MFRTPAENRHRVMFAGLAWAALVAGAAIGVSLPLPRSTIGFAVIATDSRGEAWTIGRGDTCGEAMTGNAWQAMPADLAAIDCQPVSLVSLAAR